MAYIKPGMVLGYPAWALDSAPVIPKFYWDAYSQEQRIHYICKELHKLVNYADYLGAQINLDHELIEQLQADFEKFKESGFLDYYAEQVAKWIDENLKYIFERVVKQVYFGLTDTGYFCAYIPDSWSDIQFDTGMVYGQFDYGRLILRYNVDGSGVIDNTGRYDEAGLTDLKARVTHVENTLYTNLSEGGA